jgi:putative ABC transport system permease protein
MFRNARIIFNQLTESFLFAVKALQQHKTRAFLSTLGITIGIFCIIMVLTLVESLERNIQRSVDAFGKDLIFVDKWPWTFGSDYKWWKYMNRPNPKMEEMKTINERSTLSEGAAMVINMSATVKYESNSASGVSLQGVTYEYGRIKKMDFAQGRFFNENESKSGLPVAIIGHEIAQALFPSVNPLDKTISIRGAKVKVVGVLSKEGESLLGNSMDNLVLVPTNLIARYVRLNSDRANAQIHVKAANNIPLELLEEELRGIMRSKRKLPPGAEENFALNKTTLISAPIKQLFSVVTLAGWVIGGFAMVVGGFGIANIMFVSVKERTNQIGIQKALGAKSYFILSEFLTESVLLCIVGGSIGIGIVSLLSYVANNAIDFEVYLSTKNIITGLSVSVIIGIISGILPAYNASQLNPVDAIRSK